MKSSSFKEIIQSLNEKIKKQESQNNKKQKTNLIWKTINQKEYLKKLYPI